MKKTEFIEQLRQKLEGVSPYDRKETLQYYSEMVDDYIENGYPEEEAVAKMGRPDSIAAQIMAGIRHPIYSTPVRQKEKKSGFVIALLILGFPLWFPLLVTAFCLLLTVAIVLATICMVVPWSLVVSFGASALGLLIATSVILVGEGIASAALTLGVALVLGALCIFCLWASLKLAKLGARAIGAMFRGFFNLLFGRR